MGARCPPPAILISPSLSLSQPPPTPIPRVGERVHARTPAPDASGRYPYPSRTVGGTLQPQLWLPWHRALHLAFTSTFTLANHDAPKSRSQFFASPVPDLSAFCSGPKFSRVSSFHVPSRAGARGAPGIARPLKAPPVAPKRNRYYTCHQTYHQDHKSVTRHGGVVEATTKTMGPTQAGVGHGHLPVRVFVFAQGIVPVVFSRPLGSSEAAAVFFLR